MCGGIGLKKYILECLHFLLRNSQGFEERGTAVTSTSVKWDELSIRAPWIKLAVTT
jgi:hypothetical protein